MKKLTGILIVLILLLSACSENHHVVVRIPAISGSTEILAAKEIRKYLWLRTGVLATIQNGGETTGKEEAIELLPDSTLGDEEFILKTVDKAGTRSLFIKGGSPLAMLYAAYEFAEQLGIRFYLDGDVIPDEKMPFTLPLLDIQKKPLFSTRGILPFHDFPEGPDWWNEADYKAIIAQLPKLKMNFIGLHTYPWRSDFNGEGPKAEPLVWIGGPEEINPDGSVNTAYPATHFNTSDSTWGYKPAKTSDFTSGASQLFEADNFGADYMQGISPWPHTTAENIRIFNESGKLFSSAFKFAHFLGVKVCIGTETPLVIPEEIRKKHNYKPFFEPEIKDLYKGIFTRIRRLYPVDYYWLWTPEDWTWSGVSDKKIADTQIDMLLARSALNEIGNPFNLATCGWVLGPPKDRTQFDRVLPSEMPFSCINRGVGYTPVEKGFSAISGRQKWSIPWMEDDPALLTAQLWAGRVRKDAYDSWKYGCTGLIGIHWRTRSISPNIKALAEAAWNCDSFSTSGTSRDLPVDDFYSDWVRTEFGLTDTGLVKIFTSIDSKGSELKEGYKGDAFLNASDWITGPGSLMTNRDTVDLKVRIKRYDFLERLESYRKAIKGTGNIERFDYWMNALSFNREVLRTTLIQVELNSKMNQVINEKDELKKITLARDEALPLRIGLAAAWRKMNETLLRFVSTTGELGTIANLEMHNIRKNGSLSAYDEQLKSMLKTDLPENAYLTKNYSGKTRIISTPEPSIIENGNDFYLKIRVLSERSNIKGNIYYREIGTKKYLSCDIKNISRNVFEIRIPASSVKDDFEYYIELNDGAAVVDYPSHGRMNKAVIVI